MTERELPYPHTATAPGRCGHRCGAEAASARRPPLPPATSQNGSSGAGAAPRSSPWWPAAPRRSAAPLLGPGARSARGGGEAAGRSRLPRRRLRPEPGQPATPGRSPRPFLSAPPRGERSFATLPYGRAAGSAEPGVSPRSRSPLVGRRRGACRARGRPSLRCARSWEPRLPPCSAGPPPPGASSCPRPARRPAPLYRPPAGGGGGRRRHRAQQPPPEPGGAQRCPPRRGARCCCCRHTPPASAPSRVSEPRPRAASGGTRPGGARGRPAGPPAGGREDRWPWAGTAPAGGERGRGARKSGAGFVPRGDAALGAAGGRRRSGRAAAARPALRGGEPGGRPRSPRPVQRPRVRPGRAWHRPAGAARPGRRALRALRGSLPSAH